MSRGSKNIYLSNKVSMKRDNYVADSPPKQQDLSRKISERFVNKQRNGYSSTMSKNNR